MVKTFKVYLGDKSSNNLVYSCAHCRAHLAKHENLISKSFQGSQGRAYLFDSVVNVASGKPEERFLLTGLHSVADIKCECCKTVLGWKYEQAFDPSQKYKEGKYIIEVAHLIKDTNWDDGKPQSPSLLSPTTTTGSSPSSPSASSHFYMPQPPQSANLTSTSASASTSTSTSASSKTIPTFVDAASSTNPDDISVPDGLRSNLSHIQQKAAPSTSNNNDQASLGISEITSNTKAYRTSSDIDDSEDYNENTASTQLLLPNSNNTNNSDANMNVDL